MPKKFPVYIFLTVVLLVSGCTSKKEKTRITIGRMEQSIFSTPVDSVRQYIPLLQQQYGELFDLYNLRIIAIGTSDAPDYPERLTEFVTNSYMYSAYRKVTDMYPDMKDVEAGLSKAFAEYRKHFPEKPVPSVYTLISGFNEPMITSDTILAIALDKYLGTDEEMYLRLNLANYQRRLMDRKYIVPDCIRAWIYTEFPQNDSVDNVLSNILYEGKVAYCTQYLLPDVPDSLIFGYSPEQLQWCKDNAHRMWVHLVEKKMLYSTDYLTISKLVGPAPFTSFFTRESPGRASVWLGYRIIRSYMKNNNVSLEELLMDNRYQEILAKSKFKP
jgi:hypothetical protein